MFAEALRTGSTPWGEAHSNVLSLCMVEAAIRSATEGRRVTIAALLEDAYRGAVSVGSVPRSLRRWHSGRRYTRSSELEPRHCERNAERRKTVSGSGQATQLRIGMVGYAFMGAAHAQAWRNAPRFFDLPLKLELSAVAGRNADAVRAAADRLGFASSETDWRRLVERDDIDLIDICTPGDSHSEIAIAALQAGKHVLCEKPLANTVEEAEQMAAAARAAAEREIWAMCGFTYRRTPALALARRLVDAGRIGAIRQVRAQYLQDWLADPDAPMTWRLDKTRSGSGALGDLGAHLIDTAQWLTGQSITGVSAITETFVTSRPLSGERSGLGGHGDAGADVPRGEVTVDDAAMFTARSPTARSGCSRPPGSPSVARTRCGSRSTAPTGRSPSTSRITTCCSSSTARSRSRSRVSCGSLPPSLNIRT